MRAIQRKLKSRAGASITFALLIFLVCSVVSAIVIVAASTAGGRMSGVKEMDRRYFAAKAAAEQLCTTFDNETVTLSYTKSGSTKTVTPSTPPRSDLVWTASKALVEGTTMSPLAPITKNDGNKAYSCQITPTLENGILHFDVAVTGGSTSSGTYTLIVYFTSTYMEADSSDTSGTAKVTWKLSSIKKSRGGEQG